MWFKELIRFSAHGLFNRSKSVRIRTRISWMALWAQKQLFQNIANKWRVVVQSSSIVSGETLTCFEPPQRRHTKSVSFTTERFIEAQRPNWPKQNKGWSKLLWYYLEQTKYTTEPNLNSVAVTVTPLPDNKPRERLRTSNEVNQWRNHACGHYKSRLSTLESNWCDKTKVSFVPQRTVSTEWMVLEKERVDNWVVWVSMWNFLHDPFIVIDNVELLIGSDKTKYDCLFPSCPLSRLG